MARPRVHDDAVRTRLLEAASQVVASAGPGAVTVRDVAARAGTTASAVYTLFGSREALVAEVAEEGFRRFGARLAAVRATADPRADLLALGLAYRDSALADPHFYRCMFDVPTGQKVAVADRSTFAVLRAAVARVLAADGGRADAAQEAALVLWSVVHGMVSLELSGLAPGDADARADRYRSALLATGPAVVAAGTAARP